MLRGFLHGWRRLVWFGLLLVGCDRGPAGVAAPEWDPAAAAERALSEYDANGDHKLSREELKKCPGLLSAWNASIAIAMARYPADELKSQLHEIHGNRRPRSSKYHCSVTQGGQPLEGATSQHSCRRHLWARPSNRRRRL